MTLRITQSDVIKLAEDLYNWANGKSIIGKINGEEFIWFDHFKQFIFMTRTTDKHGVKKYRDLFRYYGLLEFDVFDRVYFKFKTNDKYKITKKTGLGAWVNE